MSAFVCPKCDRVRSRARDQLCPVCWLVAELAREHRDGEHEERLNSSCITCTREKSAAPRPPGSRKLGSHAGCDHEHTPAARKRCRAQRQV